MARISFTTVLPLIINHLIEVSELHWEKRESNLQNRPCLSMLWSDCFRLEYSNLPLCFWDAHLSNSLELEFHPQISLIWQSCSWEFSMNIQLCLEEFMHLLIAYWPKSYQCLSVALCKSWLYRWMLTTTLMFSRNAWQNWIWVNHMIQLNALNQIVAFIMQMRFV